MVLPNSVLMLGDYFHNVLLYFSKSKYICLFTDDLKLNLSGAPKM